MRRYLSVWICILLLAFLWGCGEKQSAAGNPETDLSKPGFDTWLETNPETTAPMQETEPQQTTLPETEPAGDPFTWMVVTEDELNIRTGPGVEYEAQWQVHTGDLVKIYEISQGWGLTDWGWLSLNYVEEYENTRDAVLCVPTKPVPQDYYAPIIEALLNDPEDPGIEMSYLYIHHPDVSQILYALVDLDGDGQKELLLSGQGSDYPFDCFTVRNGKAVNVFSSGERYPFFVYQNGYIMNHWSNSAFNSGTDYLRYQNGKLVLLERFAYDAWYAEEAGLISDMENATGDNCWFASKTEDTSGYENISYEEVERRQQEYDSKMHTLYIEYTPITEYF